MLSCSTNHIKSGVFFAVMCFANLKVNVTKYRLLSYTFELSTHKLCKTKCITNYILRCLAKFNISDFNFKNNRHTIYKCRLPDDFHITRGQLTLSTAFLYTHIFIKKKFFHKTKYIMKQNIIMTFINISSTHTHIL